MGKVAYIHEEQATDRFERVRLESTEGRREPDVYLPGLLLKGQSHLFYGASDAGKSWIAQYAARESMRECLPVVYFDLENGPEVMRERLMDSLEVSGDELGSYLHYYPFLDLTLDRESKSWFTELLGSFDEPGLIAWDSLLGHLSTCGLSEDSSTDFEQWARFYLDGARSRGWTSMVLDHSGHAGTHERGTSRKRQNVQVTYKVEKKEHFDRTTSGRLKLTREKDRVAYLPAQSEITLGCYPFAFSLRYDGQEFLSTNTNRTLYLLYMCGMVGATHGEWKGACTTGDKKMSDKTFNRAIKELTDKKYVKKEDRRYYLTKKGESKVA